MACVSADASPSGFLTRRTLKLEHRGEILIVHSFQKTVSLSCFVWEALAAGSLQRVASWVILHVSPMCGMPVMLRV